MAKVKITGHASGTGVLTVTAPNTSTDRTITLPDATGTLLNSDGDGSNLTNLPADSTKLPLAGGTMTGTLTIEENMASDTQSTPETVASFGAKASSTGSDLAAGSGTRLELKIPSDDSPYTVTGTAIASIKELGNETNSSSALAFYTSQNDTTLDEAVRIDSSGNVGIGVTPESWDANYDALQVGGNGSLAATPSQAAGGKTLLGQNMYVDTSYKYISTDEASLLYQQNGEFKFRVAASGSADAAITWTDALIIKNDGRGLSQFTAKAWVRYDQVADSVLDSHNVSSVDDDATGKFTVNYTVAMANANYCAVGMSEDDRVMSYRGSGGVPTAADVQVQTTHYNGNKYDEDNNGLLVFGD